MSSVPQPARAAPADTAGRAGAVENRDLPLEPSRAPSVRTHR